MAELLEKSGVLADVIFHNEENGYTVAVFQNEEEQEEFIAVGTLPAAARGRRFVLSGNWTAHSRYGEQFSFTTFREELPSTKEGIEAFLASGILKGVGKKTAALLVQAFGNDTLRIIEEEPQRLTEVFGIGSAKAAAIEDAYQQHREFAAVALYFQQYGIGARYAKKLYDVYGKETIRVVENNPYQLVDDVFGIGFRTADKLAEQLGIDHHSEERLRSGILYALNYLAGEGNTYYPLNAFCEAAAGLLDVSMAEVDDVTRTLAFEGELWMEQLDGRIVVYPDYLYAAETRVCGNLMRLAGSTLKLTMLQRTEREAQVLLEEAEAKTGAAFSDQQRAAVELACKSGVCVITGGPGTGKTTIINAIMYILQESGLQAAIAAPTGRAAKRITETSGYPASTIHRLLEYYFSEGESGMRFGRDRDNPLEYDAVIVDEASMIDIQLMDGLLQALRPGTRLIIVGDADQLPSVGAGNVLRDILSSEIIPSVRLTEIFRQAGESMIVVNAHRINRGEYPDCNAKDKDFFFLRRKTEKDMLETIKDLCSRRLPNYFENCDALRDVQVLTPVHKGLLGTINLNKELQQILNPPAPEKNEKVFGQRTFREGDKVMQIRNNYQLEWKRLDDFTEGQGVFNGDCGFVEVIDTEFNEMTVVYEDNKYVKYDATTFEELELAYAVTVHKSQGSEFPLMIMPVSWFPPMLATRNLFYTAVTRAKRAVVLVGSEDKMHGMIDNNAIEERYSGLGSRLRALLEFHA